MKKYLVWLLLAVLAGISSGCSVVQLQSNIVPGNNIKSIKKFYVVKLEADQRGVSQLIADRLVAMGYQATAGDRSAMPADTEAIVTYQDKWMWDLTMYMIQLDVQLRQPKTDITMATGHSLRTSLKRKSPPEMVEEVLTDMFK